MRPTLLFVESIPWDGLGIGAGWGIVGLFVLAIMRGALVPRTTHDDVIHDRDEWRSESRIKDAQITEKDVQLRHLGEVGRTIEQLLGSAQRARLENDEGRREGAPS